MPDHLRPARDIGQPGDRPPGDKDAIERGRLGDRPGRVIEIGLDKSCPFGKAKFCRKNIGGFDRRMREIEPDHLGAALRQRQAVAAEMTLQMQNPQSIHRAKLGFLDRMQPPASRAQVG
jgi:hypothetical protein